MKKISLLLLLTISTLCLQAQCFDMGNLSAPGVTCTYGSYSNPYANVGVVNGRHTVMGGGYDDIIPQLKTVPDGEKNAIRLGNSGTGSQAESITFEYTVDNANPIVLLKYAAVMEDPGHVPSQQPRLRLEVLNSHNAAIDPECTSFDFIASPSLGWNGSSILWKDWTNIGVDLSSYSGQTIRIRLTNYDCNQSGHFGYAYIHLSCAQKRIKSQACGSVDHVTFSAPAGFEYYWYDSNGNKCGDGQTITVPMDSKLYYCDISQVGKPDCKYTTSIIAEPRFPIADFSIQQIRGCADTLYISNLSGVSKDGINKNSPFEACDEATWDLGDGRVLTDYDLKTTPITYAHRGTYTITMTVKLKDGGCTETLSKQVTVRGYEDRHVGYMYATICDNKYYRFDGQNLNKTGTYTKQSKTPNGCDSTTVLELTVNPAVEYVDTIFLCKGSTYDFQGQTITHAGTFYANYSNVLGCDSVYKLVVNEVLAYNHEFEATICDNETYDFNGRILQHPGVYIDSAQSIYGCDSVVKLTLHVNKSYMIDTYVETCHNDTFVFRGQLISEPGIFYDSLLTVHGCDSIYRCIYNKTPIYLFEESDTVCANSVYNFRGRMITEPGVYWDSLKTVSGCDSVYKLTLSHFPIYEFIDTVDICLQEDESYTYRGQEFAATGVYYDSLTTNCGCDSVYGLNLNVTREYEFESTVYICDHEPYDFRGTILNTTGTYYDSLTTVTGCDSVYILNLDVTPTKRYYIYDSLCIGSTYDFAGKPLTIEGTYYDTIYDPIGNQCQITKLDLMTKATTVLEDVYMNPFICAGDEMFEIHYKYYGAEPLRYSIHYDEHALAYGFKDVLDQNITDTVIYGLLPQMNNNSYLRPDYYGGVLEVTNGACGQSNQYAFQVLVRYPSWVIEQNWSNVVATLNAEHNGGYKFDSYLWNINGRDLSLEGQTANLYMPELHVGDQVFVHLQRVGDDYSIPTCPITIEEYVENTTNEHPIVASPTNISKAFPVMKLSASQAGEYQLYDMLGNRLLYGTIQQNESIEVHMPTNTGTYILQTNTTDNQHHTNLILIY